MSFSLLGVYKYMYVNADVKSKNSIQFKKCKLFKIL